MTLFFSLYSANSVFSGQDRSTRLLARAAKRKLQRFFDLLNSCVDEDCASDIRHQACLLLGELDNDDALFLGISVSLFPVCAGSAVTPWGDHQEDIAIVQRFDISVKHLLRPVFLRHIPGIRDFEFEGAVDRVA